MRNYATKVALLALSYYITGRLGLLLAVPPGYATAMWPPSGFALAGILLLGYRYWTGVFLGSLGVNLFTSFDPTNTSSMVTSLSVAVLIAAGAAGQASIGAWLCRRWIRFPNPLETARDIGILLMLGGPLSCLINATIGVSTLCGFELLTFAKLPFTWVTWWVGDTIGVLIFTPILLLVCDRSLHISVRRKRAVAAVLIITFIITIVLFTAAKHWEGDRQRLAFEKESAVLVSLLSERILDDGDAVINTGLLFDTSANLSYAQFRIFTQGIETHYPGIKGITWAPKVNSQDRAAFEAAQRSTEGNEFSVTERTSKREYSPAKPRDVYYPITYMQPSVQRIYGFDDYSDDIRRATMERARDVGEAQASPRVTLFRTDKDNYGMLLFQPVYLHDKPHTSVAERRANIQGFVVGAFVLSDLIAANMASIAGRDIDLYITDDNSPSSSRLLYDSRTVDHKESNVTLPAIADERHWQQRIAIGGRQWTIHCVQTKVALLAHQNWTVWLSLAVGLLFTALIGIFVMVITARTDIVRRLVEEKTRQMRESEARHQLLVDGVQDYAIYWLDPTGKVASWNRGAESIKGYKSDEVIGQHISTFYTEEDRIINVPQIALDTTLSTGHYHEERKLVRKNGTLFWASITIASLYDHEGNHTGFATVTRDITERRGFEDAIKASEATFRAAMEHASIGMALITPSGRWIEVNNALIDLLGYSKAEILATNFRAITHPDDLELDIQYVQQMLAGTIQSYQVEKRYIHQDGRTLWALLNVSLVHRPDGTAEYFVAQIQDITARKEMDRLKSEFIATVSHELRTPLTSIRGSLGLIKGGATGQLPEKTVRLVNVAYNNATRLTLIINDILDVEKMESGKMLLDIKPQSLAPILVQALEENRGYAQTYNVQLDLRTSIPPVIVSIDPGRLLQVMANFLSNAAKFSPSGGVVEIEAKIHNELVRVSIHDYGPGIPKAFQSLIFQKFCQADSSDSRAKGGTGLGLNIAKSLIEQMGGTIGYETGPESGTTFFFELPIKAYVSASTDQSLDLLES